MNDGFIPGFAAGCFIGLIILITLLILQNNRWKESAVRHGAGQFVIVDEISGRSEFKWNNEKGELK